jgi:uncharacterized protein (DUF362 family)/NAD-dependent dihydropyrimidine dehydrogenase PreA subunit
VTADVVIRSGFAGYDRDAIRHMLEGMIEASGGWPAGLCPGARVLLKVNMLAAKKPSRAITTHPAVVAALADLLLARGCEVGVGDSPGGAVKGVRRYWENCGFLPLEEDPGVTLVNFEKSGSVEMSCEGFPYNISRAILEYDAVINVCKFKTHMYTRLTNGVKNMFGAVPGLGKAWIHGLALKPRDFAVHVARICSLVETELTVMDALQTLDGKGPSTDGHVRWDGVLGVARDPVSLDMVCSKMAGLEPEELDTTREARRLGLGKPWEEVKVDGWFGFEDFDVPRESILNRVPSFLGAPVRAVMKRAPESNDRCTGCRMCVESCPTGAITIRNGRAVMNRRKCIMCLCCHELCPENAVEIRLPLGR